MMRVKEKVLLDFHKRVIDLDYAINYVKDDEQFDGLPIMLYGHSQGVCHQ